MRTGFQTGSLQGLSRWGNRTSRNTDALSLCRAFGGVHDLDHPTPVAVQVFKGRKVIPSILMFKSPLVSDQYPIIQRRPSKMDRRRWNPTQTTESGSGIPAKISENFGHQECPLGGGGGPCSLPPGVGCFLAYVSTREDTRDASARPFRLTQQPRWYRVVPQVTACLPALSEMPGCTWRWDAVPRSGIGPKS